MYHKKIIKTIQIIKKLLYLHEYRGIFVILTIFQLNSFDN